MIQKEDKAFIGIKTKNDKDIRKIKTKIYRNTESEEDYYKPVRVSNFWNDKYIEYESNGDRNENLSIKECLNEIKTHSKDIIVDLQKLGT